MIDWWASHPGETLILWIVSMLISLSALVLALAS